MNKTIAYDYCFNCADIPYNDEIINGTSVMISFVAFNALFNLKMKKILKTAIIFSCFLLCLTLIIAYLSSDNFFEQIINNADASLNFALKILMLGFVFSIVYNGLAKFFNKIFGVVNNKDNENNNYKEG